MRAKNATGTEHEPPSFVCSPNVPPNLIQGKQHQSQSIVYPLFSSKSQNPLPTTRTEL